MVLTQKEKTLIEDLKSEEKLCIEKYQKYATDAKDQQLKNLFNEIAGMENKHLSMLDSITDGTVPAINQNSGGNSVDQFTATYSITDSQDKKSDAFLCQDMLSTEKHVSSVYDTCIFEFRDDGVRNVLNHFQKGVLGNKVVFPSVHFSRTGGTGGGGNREPQILPARHNL